ncbi:MAG TPA: Xaa-Pro peptidase family protein [Bryobacteraceae bacterium]|nr:Xaa-Pro peptidase family protein [Bryobacteraceae bacterium]
MVQKLAAFLLVASVCAAKFPAEEYRARRANLRKDLKGVVVLFAHTEGRDQIYRVTPEPNFYYLTGWTEPGARLLITPAREILFLPHHNERLEHYEGHRASAEDKDAKTVTGFEEVLAIEKFESELDAALANYENLYALLGQPTTEKLRATHPFREISDGAPLVTKLRVKKSPAELTAIQHATDVSMEAHRAVWKQMVPGIGEYQLGATFERVFLDRGCDGPAYSTIVGSGPNSTVLHYSENQRRMDRGELVVMDAAAECDSYASDITRTVPVGGKFSARQREIYSIVLGAQKAAIAALKPGARLSGSGDTLTKVAKDYMDAHGKDMFGEGLGKYMLHGIGHQVGIDVHDPNIEGPLEAGMVVTIEPGIYLDEERIGVRIEDVVLVTDHGAQVLSAALAKEPDEIEKATSR